MICQNGFVDILTGTSDITDVITERSAGHFCFIWSYRSSHLKLKKS